MGFATTLGSADTEGGEDWALPLDGVNQWPALVGEWNRGGAARKKCSRPPADADELS